MAWDEKLNDVIKRAELVNKKLSSSGLSSQELQKYSKEFGTLEPMVKKIKQYQELVSNMNNAKQMLNDSDQEMAEMAKQEFETAKQELPVIEQELKIMMLPKDEADERNVIVEIRAGAGGDEAGLFAGEILRMYQRYAEIKGWKAEVIECNETDLGGYNFVSLEISGNNVYGTMKYESGGHRVQRIPETESGGRIHTSAATVAVLPEAEDVDINIDPSDLRIDTYRASGAGGQHVNTTDSAVRITHTPTGIVSQCQSGRSQHKNKDQAMKMLKTLLYDAKRQEAEKEMSDNRKSQVGSGDRSQRIKTYNFPERRVTDHRIGLTLYKLDKILNGEIDEMLEAIITHKQLEQLAQYGE
jgi:peptide chain release factor 1